ncbi:Pns1 protein [Saccharomycopsis crataegensis]|uniref:Protein PNS1 n=1 Tax=Saccharomycopsis crataegensis TaxID=43959 RepID=A0AAV5QJJ0_9ASCO|nr:Pns1 protein [Saccharomycopsis crataegensis]
MSYNRPAAPPPAYQNQNDPQYQQQQGPYDNQEQNGWTQQQQQQQQQSNDDPEKGSWGNDNMGSGKPESDAQSFDDAFKVEKPRFNDWPFAVFFYLVVFGFLAVAVITIRAYHLTHSSQGGGIYNNNTGDSLNTNTIIMFMFAIAIAVVLATMVIAFAKLWPRKFITIGLICNVIFGLGTAIAYLVMKYWSAGIVFLVFTCLCAWCYWTCRHRIPFSGAVLSIVIDVMKDHPSVLLVSLLGVVISGAFSVFFAFVVTSTYVKFDDTSSNPGCSVSGGSCSQSTLIGVLVFVFFAGYYITEVIRNVIHTTISGVYGVWYYLSKSDQGEPKNAAWGAFKRAMTYSFGSICEGSLIVAIISLIRQGINILRQNALANNEMCQAFLLCFLDMVVMVLEWLVRWFNHYAYSYIALYGTNYTSASKDVYELFRYKGFDAMINDCLINTALSFYSVFIAYVTALFVFLYLRLTKPSYNDSGSFYGPLVAFGFLIAGQIANVSTTVITSGTSTFFIALARDPEVFRLSYPEQFEEIFRTYPQVLEKLNLPHSNGN